MRRMTAIMFSLTVYALFFSGANNCAVKNIAFKSGESLTYQIMYNWGVIWVDAGEVTFSVKLSSYNGVTAWYHTGVGTTFEKYDWIYKVRDKFESYSDTTTLRPMRFVRDSKEGGSSIYEEAVFNFRNNKAYTFVKKKKDAKIDSCAITNCTVDVMTAIYYARNMDFSKCKPNDTIPLQLYLENKNYPVYVRYIGKEVFNLEGVGKFNCIRFRPLLIEGTIFSGGEKMDVWVTDDKNKIPLYVETPILVGKIKVKLKKVSGIRHPSTSVIK